MAYVETKDDDPWSAAPGRPVDPGRVSLSFKRDWHWIPLAGLTWGALGLIVAFGLITTAYRSHAALVWSPKNAERPDDRTLAAEVANLRQPAAVAKIREQLKLAVPLSQLDRQFDLHFEPHSKLLVLSADGVTGQAAAQFQRAVVDTFLEQQRGFARDRAKVIVANLEKEATVARNRVEEARAALTSFQTENAPPPPPPVDAKTGTGGSSGGRATKGKPGRPVRDGSEAQAQVKEPESPVPGKKPRHSSLWRFLTPPPGAAGVPSPRRAGLDGESGTGAEAAAANRAALDRTEHSLKRAVRDEEEKVAELTQAIERAQAQIADPANDWRVLTPPTRPARPERTKENLIATLMPLAGMLFALLALLGRPLTGARVYTAREACYWSKLPVLASSSWPRNRDMFFPLIDELGQQAGGAPGNTLLVGVTGVERAQAEELAYWLGGGPVGSRNRGPDSASPSSRVEPEATSVAVTPPQAFIGSPDGTVSVEPSYRPAETLVVFEPKVASGRPESWSSPHPEAHQGIRAWLGEVDGPALRRAVRVADRVIVLVSSGTLSFGDLSGLRTRLGRSAGVAIVMLNIGPTLLRLPDQAGPVGKFWRMTRR